MQQLNGLLSIGDFVSLINGRVSATISRYLNRQFKAAGLNITTEQWSVLSSLWMEDKQTQQRICEHTYKDKASMTRLLDNLEKNGLVTRESDPSDRRINLIHLTPEGKELEYTANRIVEDSIRISTRDIPSGELLFIIDVFKKIIGNLEKE